MNMAPVAGRGGEGGAVGPGAAVLGGKLYAVGGSDENSNALDTVEAFDPEANRWTAVASMSTWRCK